MTFVVAPQSVQLNLLVEHCPKVWYTTNLLGGKSIDQLHHTHWVSVTPSVSVFTTKNVRFVRLVSGRTTSAIAREFDAVDAAAASRRRISFVMESCAASAMLAAPSAASLAAATSAALPTVPRSLNISPVGSWRMTTSRRHAAFVTTVEL